MFLAVATFWLLCINFPSIQSIDDDPPIQKKIENMKLFKNLSDEELLVDPATFINEFGPKPALRLKARYLEPKEMDVRHKAMDLMKQAIYGTQARLRDLDPVLEKYKDSPSMKMAFLYGRMKQLIIDMRRIHTLALKKRGWKKVIEHIVLYQYIAKKHIDIIYIVEHVIEIHKGVMAQLAEFLKEE
ncbi:unnamed protein product [Colias eurytheme]|nr:unnamed protein product [Colias eurytheme]